MKHVWSMGLDVLLALTVGAMSVVAEYCWYIDDRRGRAMSTYCTDGCCHDYGDEGDICCFTWSLGVIIGVIIAVVSIIAGIAAIVICCYMAKKKRRLGAIMQTTAPQRTTAVVYTGGPGIHPYSYPHPPSGYYPRHPMSTGPPTALYGEGGAAYPAAIPPPPSYSQATASNNNASLFQVGTSHSGGTATDKCGGYGT